ncbi:TPA: hypothetical protein DDW35_01920 [Candidatus Sumerlaeota bacterium]|jgi:hypothetical protein|nr:hypothetical protein [Candidatus Sumerlaeota bacterium]
MKRKVLVSFAVISLLAIALPSVCLARHPHWGWGVGVSVGPGYYYPEPYPYVGIGVAPGMVWGPDYYVVAEPAPIVVAPPVPLVVVRENPVVYSTTVVAAPPVAVVRKTITAPPLQPIAPPVPVAASSALSLPSDPTLAKGTVAPDTFSLDIVEVGDLRSLGGQIRAPFTRAFVNAGFKINTDQTKWTQYQVRVEVKSTIQPVDSNGVRHDAMTLQLSTRIVDSRTGQTMTLSNQTPFQQTIVNPTLLRDEALRYLNTAAADAIKKIQK